MLPPFLTLHSLRVEFAWLSSLYRCWFYTNLLQSSSLPQPVLNYCHEPPLKIGSPWRSMSAPYPTHLTIEETAVGLFVCLVGFVKSLPTTLLGYIADGPQDWRRTIISAATHETEQGDHDFCLSRSHCTDTHPTSRERAAAAGMESWTSSPGVARSTDWATVTPEETADLYVRGKSPTNVVRTIQGRSIPHDLKLQSILSKLIFIKYANFWCK